MLLLILTTTLWLRVLLFLGAGCGHKAGIQLHDCIVAINGSDITEMDHQKTVDLLVGGGENFSVVLVREEAGYREKVEAEEAQQVGTESRGSSVDASPPPKDSTPKQKWIK